MSNKTEDMNLRVIAQPKNGDVCHFSENKKVGLLENNGIVGLGSSRTSPCHLVRLQFQSHQAANSMLAASCSDPDRWERIANRVLRYLWFEFMVKWSSGQMSGRGENFPMHTGTIKSVRHDSMLSQVWYRD